ncbi:MAG TPA: hypothetical protein VKQ08_08285 [Cyclobacteriaceae bacterium]|nr:hypothetical protein [Cyclobacteriaceae bacterium]
MHLIRAFFLLSVLTFWVWSCKQNKSKSSAEVTALGRVDQRLEEASGLVASVGNPGMLWTLNDSGNPPEIFLIDRQAKTRLVCTLMRGRNRDWEDIALGAGPDPHKKYVYVADIGDNWAQYELKFIYRFAEPALGSQKEITITQFDTLTLKMPDGKRDAETILIDPLTNDLFLISKREDFVALYTAPFPFSGSVITLRKVATLPFTKIVAGSISQDGTEILLKDYEKVYYWKRTTHESLEDALAKKPVELPYERERQGEAIAWSLDAREFYTLSEGTGQPANLYVYKMKK